MGGITSYWIEKLGKQREVITLSDLVRAAMERGKDNHDLDTVNSTLKGDAFQYMTEAVVPVVEAYYRKQVVTI